MSKTILVLAASTYQVPVIQTAKKMGYRVVTTDNEPTNPGHKLADKCYFIDTMDEEKVAEIAGRERISGVIAAGTDIAVKTAAYVAEELSLTGPSKSAATLLTDRHAFRRFLRSRLFPCPDVIAYAQNSTLCAEAMNGRVWIMKPNRSSGSKGVFIVDSYAEYQLHIAESLDFSGDRTVVLEEFVKGTQHTCEGILQKGKAVLAMITDRDTAKAPYAATVGHRFPSYLSDVLQAKVLELVEKVFTELGVNDGPFDCDFVVSKDEVFLLEMTPRLGGNSLPRLFRVALDYDIEAYAIKYACRDRFQIPGRLPLNSSAVSILGVSNEGRLCWNDSEEERLRGENWVHRLQFDFPQGTPVQPFINGRNRLGEVLISGENRRQVDERLFEVDRRLDLKAV